VVFPVEYGFVPQTYAQDSDPLDIMTLSYEPLEVGAIAKVRVIGILVMEDEEGLDYKILSVLLNDLRFNSYTDLSNVQEYQLKEIAEFFTTYKRLEPCRWAKVQGWRSRQEAEQIILASMKSFQDLMKK
jgi:inorganic pyrophosphatase